MARDFLHLRRGEAHSEQSRPYKPAFHTQRVELRSLVQTWIIESVETVQLTERNVSLNIVASTPRLSKTVVKFDTVGPGQ